MPDPMDAALDGILYGILFAIIVGLPLEVLTFWLTGWGLT